MYTESEAKVGKMFYPRKCVLNIGESPFFSCTVHTNKCGAYVHVLLTIIKVLMSTFQGFVHVL